jgi:hypothetical protein
MYNLLIISDKIHEQVIQELKEASMNCFSCSCVEAPDIIKDGDFDIIIYSSEQNFNGIHLQLTEFNSILKRSPFVFIDYKHEKEKLPVRSYFMSELSSQKIIDKLELLISLKMP